MGKKKGILFTGVICAYFFVSIWHGSVYTPISNMDSLNQSYGVKDAASMSAWVSIMRDDIDGVGATRVPVRQPEVAPVTVSGRRFISQGVPYYPVAEFLGEGSPLYSHPYFSDSYSHSDRKNILDYHNKNGYNTMYIYTMNQGDYDSRWLTPYVDSGSFVIGGEFDESKIAWWRSELEHIISQGIRPVLWLFPDDSPAISNASISEKRRYIQKMIDSFDDLPIMWVLALEANETNSCCRGSKSTHETLGRYLQDNAANIVGVHLGRGQTSWMKGSWVDFGMYQYQGSWVSVYNNFLKVYHRISGPMIHSEYIAPGQSNAKHLGVAAAFAHAAGLGNGAPKGLVDFMQSMPDSMKASLSGDILILTGGGVTAKADMSDISNPIFWIESIIPPGSPPRGEGNFDTE
jgi:hypothetical protein